jgi:hypothetical protein
MRVTLLVLQTPSSMVDLQILTTFLWLFVSFNLVFEHAAL